MIRYLRKLHKPQSARVTLGHGDKLESFTVADDARTIANLILRWARTNAVPVADVVVSSVTPAPRDLRGQS